MLSNHHQEFALTAKKKQRLAISAQSNLHRRGVDPLRRMHSHLWKVGEVQVSFCVPYDLRTVSTLAFAHSFCVAAF